MTFYRQEVGLEAVFLALQTDFFANFGAVKFDGSDRKTDYFRDFFGFFPLPDQVGNLDLLGGQSEFDRGKTAGKRRCDFSQIGGDYVQKGGLPVGERCFFQIVQIRFDQLLDIQLNFFFNLDSVVISFF